MQQLSRIIFRNSFSGVAAHITIKILSFAFGIFTVRFLGADSMGEYLAVLAFGRVFIFIADLGLGPYTVRKVARLREQPDSARLIHSLYGAVLRLRVLLSFIATALVLLVAWLTARPPVMIGAIALNMLGLILFSVQGTSESVLAGYERLGLPAKAKVYNQLIYVIFGGLALWLGLGYYGLIVITLLGILTMLWICWRAVRDMGVRPVWSADWPMWSLLRTSLPFGIISFALGLSYNFDTILLNLYRGNNETTYYSAAYGLAFTVLFLSNAINTALYPSLSRVSVSNAEHLPALYQRFLNYLLILSLPIAVGGTVLAEPLIRLLYGESLAEHVVPVLRIVIWVVPLMFVSELLGYVVVISDKERFVARSVVVSTCVNIGLNLLMIPLFGLYAAAVMTVLTECVLVTQYLWLLRSTLAHFSWSHVLFRPLLAALIMGWAVYMLQGLPVILTILIGAAIYSGLLAALRVLGKDEFRFMLGMFRRSAPQPSSGSSD